MRAVNNVTGLSAAHLLLGEWERQPLDQDCQQDDGEPVGVRYTNVGQP